MHPLTLRFPVGLEAEYRADYTRESMPFVRVMIVLGACIYLLFGVWDYLLFPAQKDRLWLVRVAVVAPVLLATFYATYQPRLQPHWQTFLAGSSLVAIGALVAMMFVLPDGAATTHIHPGIQMCLMFCFTAFKLRFVQALAVGLAGIALFHGVAAGPLQFPVAAQIGSAFFLVGSLFTGALTAWLLERYSRSAFVQRRENDRLIRALETEKQVAIEANASKSRFLAAASHDLRQPLHAIGLLADLLRDRTRDAELHTLGDGIHRAVRAMEHQFGGLLDMSRLDAGMVPIDVRLVALQGLAATLRVVHEPAARAKGLALTLDGAGLQVASDPQHLERILGNLIDNAIKYTDRGGVTMTACRDGEAVRIDVADTGRGIAPDQTSRIFEAFYQIGNVARDRAQGLGIGLSIVQRLASLLGHRLSLASTPGSGSCFSLWVPWAERRSAPVQDGDEGTDGDEGRTRDGGIEARDAVPDSAGAPATDALHGTFVVVIDDEADVRQALGAVLAAWGCHRVLAASADEALDALAGHLRPPDILLCDFRLGDAGSGLDAIRRVRAASESTIPALLLTGDPQVAVPPELVDVGLAQKPVHGERLRRLLLERRRGATAGP